MVTRVPISIAIVGAGFSGTATALNLLGMAARRGLAVTVHLIDRDDMRARGLAYATGDDNLVLNVPTGNMSALADQPDDFLSYCHELDASLNSGSFVYRRLYGEYLQQRLQQAADANPGALVQVNDRVTALTRADRYTLTLQSGATLQVDRVVLAFGHFTPRRLQAIIPFAPADSDAARARCVDNPWAIRDIDLLDPDKDVCVVGTGHTAIDTVFRLATVPAARRIVMVSRHGCLPNGHRRIGEFVKLPALNKEIDQALRTLLDGRLTVAGLMRAVRQLIAQHGNWRDVINSLRPITPQIWQALPVAERARFLRHVVPYWDVVRHRLAPVAMRRIDRLVADGRVQIIAARLTGVAVDADGLQVGLRQRGTTTARQHQFGAIINCTGPNYDIHQVDNPLVRQLAADGLLRQDAMRIGFEVDDSYRISASPDLYYIGPMLKARYWEAIAVPELRQHAHRLAEILLSV